MSQQADESAIPDLFAATVEQIPQSVLPTFIDTEPEYGIFNPIAREFLRQWEESRVTSAVPIDQAEFFAPKELLTSDDTPATQKTSFADEDVPLHPSAPRIVISEPDAVFEEAQTLEKDHLKKSARLDDRTKLLARPNKHNHQIKPTLRERRHSIVNLVPDRTSSNKSHETSKGSQPRPTPRPWTTDVVYPKDGWKMRVRSSIDGEKVVTADVIMVYLYNSAIGQHFDRDADLNIFRYDKAPESRKSDNLLAQKIERARTDLDTSPKRAITDSFAAAGWSASPSAGHSASSRNHHVSWLTDENMLREKLPGMRFTIVGYDIQPVLNGSPNFESAAEQLHDYLLQHQNDHPRVPKIFLGHTLGGVFIIKALSTLQKKSPFIDNLLLDTAGLFLFSWDLRSQNLGDIYGTNAAEKDFTQNTQKSVTEMLSNLRVTRLCSHYPILNTSNAGQIEPKTSSRISVGFPIFQVYARDEVQVSGDSYSNSLSSLLDTPIRTITIDKNFPECLKFPSSKDPDFLRLAMLFQSTLQTHKLLHASASNRIDELHSMIRRGANVNLRDRWSQTALQIAVRMNHEDVVLKLLSVKTIDPNVRDKLSNTPLHYAVRTGNETVIRALLHHGADIGIENQRKRTPRDLAEKHKSRKHIAKLLKSKLMSGPDQSLSSKRIGTGKPPSSSDGALACKYSQITVTEVYAIRNSDKHWSVNVSVDSLLYGPTALEDILDQVRPQAVKAHTPLCVWIHVPETNMVWLEDLFAKLRLHPAIWQDTRRSITDSLRNRAITPHFNNSGDISSLFLPYLSYEANFRQAKRTMHVQAVDATYQHQRNTDLPFATSGLATLSEGSSKASNFERRPLLDIPQGKDLESYPYFEDDSDSNFSDILTPADPDDLEEEEKALINAYLYNPPGLHVRRTLDQYYYHMLESTQERDIDQVVSRWAQDVKSELRHNILMVDQLWLWTGQTTENSTPGELEMEALKRQDRSQDTTPQRKSTKYVVSCFPSRTGSGHVSHRTLDDLRLRVLLPNNRKRDPIRAPGDLVSRILETCFSIFDRMQDLEMLRFFQMFEDSIGTIDDKESRLFRDFQRGSNRLLELDSSNKFYHTNKNSLLTDLLDIREEIKLLVEVKDIRDEINIILSVLSVQNTLITQMGRTKEGALLRGPVVANMVAADIIDFTKLDSQARTIQEKLNTLMDLKQKAANAWEAKEARETAVAATKQGNTVLVFTVVTIVFLPLSFMSSFFAIGIAAFPHHPESGEVNWPLDTVMGLLFGISLCVSIPLIIFALNMDFFTLLYQELRNNYLANLGIWLISLLPQFDKRHETIAERRRWTNLLEQHRQDYMRNEE